MKETRVFSAGDAIIHPVRGAGVVVGIEERQWRGSRDRYYKIQLLGQRGVTLMVPLDAAEMLGLRRTIPRSKLEQVWRVLQDDPRELPDNHKQRYQLLKDKLHAGDVFQVAEVVRDMTWRRRDSKLTTVGKRLYDEGLSLLAGEIAATQDIDLSDAEVQITGQLGDMLGDTAAN